VGGQIAPKVLKEVTQRDYESIQAGMVASLESIFAKIKAEYAAQAHAILPHSPALILLLPPPLFPIVLSCPGTSGVLCDVTTSVPYH